MKLVEQRDPLTGEVLLAGRTGAGLAVRLLPRRGYRQTIAQLAVDYGSVDGAFTPRGTSRRRRLPDGIAHFLEHKMFEKERGDLLSEFAREGGMANAMTWYTWTRYDVQATANFASHLERLLELVFCPWFTEELVQKEQGIIEQELRSYDDDPGSRAVRAMLAGMFRRHPVKEDIGGTVDSVRRISAKELSLCHENFYVPSNMVLVVGGREVDPDAIERLVDARLGKRSDGRRRPERWLPTEPRSVAEKSVDLGFPVALPRLLIGYKDPRGGARSPAAITRRSAALGIALEALFGPSSEIFEELYGSGLVGEDLARGTLMDRGFGLAYLGAETPDPEELEARLDDYLATRLDEVLTEETLEPLRRRMLGAFIRSLDNLDGLCGRVVSAHFKRLDPFGVPEIYLGLRAATVRRVAREILRSPQRTRVRLRPGEA